jgi:hypothetical protein
VETTARFPPGEYLGACLEAQSLVLWISLPVTSDSLAVEFSALGLTKIPAPASPGGKQRMPADGKNKFAIRFRVVILTGLAYLWVSSCFCS